MLNTIKNVSNTRHAQRGAAAVEFAIIAMLLFTVLFGIIEFGRLFYVINTVQEVTRRAAREAVVRWVDNSDTSPAKVIAPAFVNVTKLVVAFKLLSVPNVSSGGASRSPSRAIDRATAGP